MTKPRSHYLVICGQCQLEIAANGVKRVLPYKMRCPRCGFTAKLKIVRSVLSMPRSSRRMLVLNTESFAYDRYIERKRMKVTARPLQKKV